MSYDAKRLAVYGIVGILASLPIIAAMTLIPWAEPVAETKPVIYYSSGLPAEYRAWPLNMPNLNLTISDFTEPLGVGSRALLKAAIKSPYDVTNATVKLDLLQASGDQPIGISFVDEDSRVWNVDLDADVLISFDAEIEAIEIGYARILATATWHDDLEGHIKVYDALWVSVLENDIQVSRGPGLYTAPYTAPQGLEIESYIPQFFLLKDNESVPEATANFILSPYKPHEGILSNRWMELITSVAICTWVSLIASRVTLYFHGERVILERRKLGVLMVTTIIGGVGLAFASGLHQIRPVIMDAQEIYYGFPFVWLKAFRGTWMTVTPWRYNIQWFGLIGDLALYSWVAFIVSCFMFYLWGRLLKAKLS